MAAACFSPGTLKQPSAVPRKRHSQGTLRGTPLPLPGEISASPARGDSGMSRRPHSLGTRHRRPAGRAQPEFRRENEWLRETFFLLPRLSPMRPEWGGRAPDSLTAAEGAGRVDSLGGERRHRSLQLSLPGHVADGQHPAAGRLGTASPRPRGVKNAGKARYRSHHGKTQKEFT